MTALLKWLKKIFEIKPVYPKTTSAKPVEESTNTKPPTLVLNVLDEGLSNSVAVQERSVPAVDPEPVVETKPKKPRKPRKKKVNNG